MHNGGDGAVIKAGNREGEEGVAGGRGGVMQSCLIVAFQRTGD